MDSVDDSPIMEESSMDTIDLDCLHEINFRKNCKRLKHVNFKFFMHYSEVKTIENQVMYG
jgi:hypothetical protein